MSTAESQRLQTRLISPSELLAEETVLSRGFAGHTLNEYPEPARSYYISYARLEPILRQLHTPIPLLVYVDQELVGVMNSVWTTRVGAVPVRRMSQNQLEVVVEKVTFLTGETIRRVSFATNEILITVPSWCR